MGKQIAIAPRIDFIRVTCKSGRWRPDRVDLWRLFNQLRKEAELTDEYPDPPDAYDRLLTAAGKHNIGLEYDPDEKTPFRIPYKLVTPFGELHIECSREGTDRIMRGCLVRCDFADGSEAIDAITSMVIAHAVAGIAVDSHAYVTGLITTLEAIDNNADG